MLLGLWQDARAVLVVVGPAPARDGAVVIGEALRLAARGEGHRPSPNACSWNITKEFNFNSFNGLACP